MNEIQIKLCRKFTFSPRNSERIHLEGPFTFPACYGCQVVYKMPRGNFMFIHLKDKTKIRRKKRWSQVLCCCCCFNLCIICIIDNKSQKREYNTITAIKLKTSHFSYLCNKSATKRILLVHKMCYKK